MLRSLVAVSLLGCFALGCRTQLLTDPSVSEDGGAQLPDLTGAAPADLWSPPHFTSDFTVPPQPSVDFALPPPPRADLAVPPPIVDLAVPPPVDAGGLACGNQTCPAGQHCCINRNGMGVTLSCMNSCPDGGVGQIACDGPGTCGGNPCCIRGGQGGFGAITCEQAPNACVPTIDFQTRQLTTRLCMADGDCTAGDRKSVV